MNNYIELCKHVLENGMRKPDRTGTGTISTFGYQIRCNLDDGFPLLTTKKVYYKAVLGELLWIISGETNIRPLVLQNIRIWNEWPYENYKKSKEYQGETMEEFIEKIKNSEEFALKHGDLGPVYGKQWRDSYGVDQLLEVEKSIKENPFSRRHIICAWNPSQVKDMALPPCHAFLQFYVSGDGKKLSFTFDGEKNNEVVKVPLIYYKGYKAYIKTENGKKYNLKVEKDDKTGQLLVSGGSGLKGTVTVEYKMTFIQFICYTIYN